MLHLRKVISIKLIKLKFEAQRNRNSSVDTSVEGRGQILTEKLSNELGSKKAENFEICIF
jgi:hypothetical protein